VRSLTRNLNPLKALRWTAGAATLAVVLLSTTRATAEVTIAKGETWDAFVSGRVGAFFSFAAGQGYPVPKQMGSKIEPGGGVDPDPSKDTIYEDNAMGMPDTTKQGRISKMRLRSGYYPNILTFGAHKKFGENLKLTGQLSIWGNIESDDDDQGKPTIEPLNGNRDNGVKANFREGFLKLEGGWGEVDGGRFMNFVGRDLTEMDVLYGHGYGAGFPAIRRNSLAPVTGDLFFPGPTGGMTGFGVLAASYSAGLAYTTPSLAGLKIALGLFDPVKYTLLGWNTTRTVRPEGVITYDLKSGGVGLHLAGSGSFQTMNLSNSKVPAATIWASTFSGRVEVGPVRLGVGGFVGKGAGVTYAFDPNPALVSVNTMRSVTTTNPDGSTTVSMEKTNEFRSQRGFVGMAQVVLGQFDLGAGVGQTQILLLPEDRAVATTLSVLKTQTGIFGAIVYHLNENFHFDVDFINGGYRWYGGESQKLNVINAGATVTF
jgi:hypothetical protein